MSNRRRFRGRRALGPLSITSDIRHAMEHYRSFEGYDPVSSYSAHVLRSVLVGDAVRMWATDPIWVILAFIRLAEMEHTGTDAAFRSVEGEVRALTGRGMPVHSGPIVGGTAS